MHGGSEVHHTIMNPQPLSITELLNAPERWTGEFLLHCHLLVDTDDQCWLAESADGFAAGRRIAIPGSQQIAELLYDSFPAHGGGIVVFDADCTGRFQLDGGVIRTLSDCELRDRHFQLIIHRFEHGQLMSACTPDANPLPVSYLKVKWSHSFPDAPILLYMELDAERWELRKVEVFADGRLGYSDGAVSVGSVGLGVEPVPPLEEIASDPAFEPTEIAKEEFEEKWLQRRDRR